MPKLRRPILSFCLVLAGCAVSGVVPGSVRAQDPAPDPGADPDPSTLEIPAAADTSRISESEFAPDALDLENFDDLGAHPEFESMDWDSVFAAFDTGFAKQGPGIDPLVGLRYSDVEGLHLEGGVGVGPRWRVLQRVEARFGYDISRERPNASGRLRVGPTSRERYGLELEIHDRVRVYGNHRPYGNTLFTFIAGYDAQAYLRERAGSAAVFWRPWRTLLLRAGYARFRQDPLPVATQFHLFGPDRWMEFNPAADRLHARAIRFEAALRPRYSGDVVMPGLYLGTVVNVHGGTVLGGDREYTTLETSFEYIRFLPWRDDRVSLAVVYRLTGGEPPFQALQDLGGAAGLRAFEPRRFLGHETRYARLQYLWSYDLFRATRLPWIKRARLRLVPFAEVGSAWLGLGPEGEPRMRDRDDLRDPRFDEIHWDLGFGLRRNVESSGLLSFVEVDFAWPMGGDTGPVRITARLSSVGFD